MKARWSLDPYDLFLQEGLRNVTDGPDGIADWNHEADSSAGGVILTGKFGDWSPITVHLDGAISVRKREAAFKGQMFASYPADLVFSKIDVRNGAIALVPHAITKAVITPEFPVLMPHPDKIDGRYLELILLAGGYVAALRRKASGTSGRKRITPPIFLDLAIPLPPLAAQQALEAAHRAALVRAAADEAKAEALELQAAAEFAEALGLAPPAPLLDSPVFIAKFRDLDRWSHEAVQAVKSTPNF